MSEGDTRYEGRRQRRAKWEGDGPAQRFHSEGLLGAVGESENATYATRGVPAYDPSNEPEAREGQALPASVKPTLHSQSPWEGPASAQYYRRPTDQPGEGIPEAEMAEAPAAFAPPPKFAMPQQSIEPLSSPESVDSASQPQRNVYQTRQATWAETARLNISSVRDALYQVSEDQKKSSKSRPGKRIRRKRILVGVCALVVLAGAIYLSRDWIGRQMALLLGVEQAAAPLQETAESPIVSVKGYDAAPQTPLQMKTRQGIDAIRGSLEMETVAVTLANVVTRSPRQNGLFDYYLFAASDGRLLGYYEGIGATDFLVQPNDSFYIKEPPYLVNSQGKALIKAMVYESFLGEKAVLGPLENDWAIVSDLDKTQLNYVNAEGVLLSQLWFCRAIPFWGTHTLAYVDTGNLAKPEERFALYVLSKEGTMTRWQYAADTEGLLGSACGLAWMSNGDLIRLSDQSTLCKASEVAAYLDCDALVVKDQATGKYGLFVGGEQHYDFVYDHIAPVVCDIEWQEKEENGFLQYAVTGASYPQPLSHYFALQKDGGEEMIALSTRSYCPVIME